MSSRWRAFMSGASLTVALVFPGSTAATSPAQAATRCDLTGQTVARSATVRIYRLHRGSVTKPPRYFACMRNGHTPARRLPLDRGDTVPFSYTQVKFKSFRIAGRFVAYVKRDSHPEDLIYSVWSLNAATGRARRYYTTDSSFIVTGLVVNREGSVAYLDEDICRHCRYPPYDYAPDPPPSTFHVYRGDGGTRVVLDSGEDIDPASLKLIGSEVQWVRGGQPQSAPLGGRGLTPRSLSRQ